MIDVYFWPTPNCYKVTILLEELGLAYNVVPVHIGKGEQFAPRFLELSPAGKVPALLDHHCLDGQPLAIFESGAIMLYLARKAGWRFLPDKVRPHAEVTQWLMFQMASVGPMLGQAHHFRRYAPEPIPYAIERYTREARKIYAVLDRRLRDSEWLCDDYSIADMAVFPWMRPHNWQGQALEDFPHLHRWYLAIRSRSAVQRGISILSDKAPGRTRKPAGKAWDILFGESSPASC